MCVATCEICSETRGYTKEVGDANRRLGMLIYKATIGMATEDERAELGRLVVETPEMLKKAGDD